MSQKPLLGVEYEEEGTLSGFKPLRLWACWLPPHNLTYPDGTGGEDRGRRSLPGLESKPMRF